MTSLKKSKGYPGRSSKGMDNEERVRQKEGRKERRSSCDRTSRLTGLSLIPTSFSSFALHASRGGVVYIHSRGWFKTRPTFLLTKVSWTCFRQDSWTTILLSSAELFRFLLYFLDCVV